MAGAQTLRTWARAARDFDPVRATWRLLTSVGWAIVLIMFLAVASLLGVLLPQIPGPIRGDGAAVSVWLESQRGRYGVLTDVLYRLGLFDVFHAPWFAVGLGLLVVSVALCTASRFFPIWRSIRRPQRRVPDTYFQRARHRISFAVAADPAVLAAVLRRHRYRVEEVREGEATYVFADRFAWAQLGTFLTHLALILFIAAALVSRFTGFSASLFIAEGTSAPVFPVKHANQMQVQVIDTVGRFDEQGQPLDYRTEMAIYQGGREVKRCTATVNGPCGYGGYRFHQAAYFGFGAELQVRDVASGNVVYKEVLALADTMPAPRVVIRDKEGQPLLDKTLVLTDFIEGAYGTTVRVPGGDRAVWIGARPDPSGDGWQLVAFEPGDNPDPVRLVLEVGEKATAGGLQFEFVSLNGLPASFERGVPLPAVQEGDASQGTVFLQMSNVVYGTEEASSGRPVSVAAVDGPPTLTIIGVSPRVVNLEPGQSAVLGGYEYTFLGQREFAGIQVKRDRSDNLIWAGAALLLVGLGVTFYVPRRRLWAKIAPNGTFLAGVAGHLTNFRREMGNLAAEAGLAAGEQPKAEADSPGTPGGDDDGSA